MKQIRKLLALALVLAAMVCAVVFAQAAETENVMNLWMEAPKNVSLNQDEVDYTIMVKNTNELATITITVELDAAHVEDPWVEMASGWTMIASRDETKNGTIEVSFVGSNFGGLTTDKATEIAVIHAENKSSGGLGVAMVTRVDASYYQGEEEAYVHSNLKDRVVRTQFGPGGAGGPMSYSFNQSSQLGLIEPWFLLSNLYVYHEDGSLLTAEEIEDHFLDYGAYFVRKDDLEELSVDDIINSDKAYLITKADGATVKQGQNGAMISVSYDQGIYTYELDTTFCVLFYVEGFQGRAYDVIKERNIANLVAVAKNMTSFHETERAVYRRMEELYAAVTAHRATFEEIPELPVMSAPHSKLVNFGAYETGLGANRSNNIVLIEPWGLKVNAYVSGEYEDYGLLVGTQDELEDLINRDTSCRVFSQSNGHAQVETGTNYGTRISGVFNSGIYTYQLDRELYTACFVMDSDGTYQFSDVRSYNILDLVTQQAAREDLLETERAVYQAMLNLNTDVRTHRARFGLK